MSIQAIFSFCVALALGLPLDKVVKSIESGLGGTLGHIALIFSLGAMLGRLISDAGGGQRIAVTLIEKFGERYVQWAVVVASFIIGIALFFEVGLVLLVPIVLTMAKQMKLSPLHLGVPMCAALLATHAFLPPHPGPTVIRGEAGIADSTGFAIIRLVGDASVSMVVSLLFAMWTMGVKRNIPVKDVMASCTSAANHIGMMLLIIGGGGAFKQVLIDGGGGKYVAELFAGSNASPLIFA